MSGTYIVKVADFGLSRDIYEKDYYQALDRTRPLPMKWMAIESLKEGRYTVQSDVVRLRYSHTLHCKYDTRDMRPEVIVFNCYIASGPMA